MKRAIRIIGKIVKWSAVVVVALLLLLLAGGYFYVRRSLPRVEGTAQVSGLGAPVEIIRDADAVPHIYAQNKLDAFRGLGYVHAQDRLWQMEFQRRVGQGRLSEVFGAGTLTGDRLLRTLGAHRAARSAWDAFPPESKEVVEAYVSGINAYIAAHSGSDLSPEFSVLGVKPEPWTGPDVLVWVKMMAWNLDSVSYATEIMRNDIARNVGAERAQQLLPNYPEDGPVIERAAASVEGAERLVAAVAGLRELTGYSALNGGGLGSNSWVVDGTKSTTGKPVLANDPHLGTSIPSTWYLAHLSAGDFDVIGATIPGLPMVVIGRNRSISWGLTHLVADVQDLYRERLDEAGRMADWRGQMEPLQFVTETIKVKGQADVQQTVRITRHGPLISDAINASDAELPEQYRMADSPLEPLAMRWPALDADDRTVDAFLRVNAARNPEEFKDALRGYVAPAMNFVYADQAGNIGYLAPGRLPVRLGSQSTIHPEGWTGDGDWGGYIPFEELPQSFNPPEHFIVTANNRPVRADYKYFLGNQWFPAYRARRISELLSAKERVSPEDHAAIQGDTVSLQTREMLPLLFALVSPRDEEERRAVELLRAWDGDTKSDSAAAAIYEAWTLRLPRALLSDELGAKLAGRYEERFEYQSRFLTSALRERSNPWCDDVKTPEREDCGQIVDRTFREALGSLKTKLGDDMAQWRWGQLHVATFPHIPFHHVGLLRRFFSRSIPNGGDRSTVNVGPFGYEESFEQSVAPGYRQIVNLASLDDGRFIQAVGQSGHFLSPHYDDYIVDWQAVRYRPMRLERAAVERSKQAVLRLQP